MIRLFRSSAPTGKMRKDSRLLGKYGEWLAYDHLIAEDYDVLARNWEAPFGEVDIIAGKDGNVHFIEVKTRHASRSFRPEDSVTADKMDKYQRLAVYFLKQHRLTGTSVRYHIISIEIDENNHPCLEMMPMLDKHY